MHTSYAGRRVNDREYWQEYEDLFTYNGLAQKIIKAPADEAVRAGFSLKDGEADIEQNDVVQSILEDLDFQQVFSTALCWDRLFGGGAVLMMLDDGGELSEPVNEKQLRRIESMKVYDAQDVNPLAYCEDPTDDRYGLPNVYTVINYNGASFNVDASRLLIFDGGIVSNRRRRERNGWGGSIMEQVQDNLERYNTSHDFATLALERLSQSVTKFDGLADMLSTEFGEKQVEKRLQLIDMARGMMNTIALDKEDEYDLKNVTLAGIKDVLDEFEIALCAAADISATVLFGRSPQGQNSTGESDLENYYNMIERIQQRKIKPQIYRLLHLMDCCSEYALNLPQDFTVDFAKLWNPSAKEQAETKQIEADARAKEAAAAAQYVSLGALDPQEVRQKLDDGDEYDLDRSIDKVMGTPVKDESDDGNHSEA
nr:MAG TPA: Portal [Caudoviricetes sp.]